MIIGYTAGRGLLHRAHPFTPFALAGAVVVWAFALPAPVGPAALAAALALLVLVAQLPGALATALAMAAPFWAFLLVIHWGFGDTPLRAVTVGSQITAMLIVFVAVVASVHPARLVDALVERRVPFTVAYLLAATLQAVPRLRDRARGILDAQRCRGLKVRGSLWRRVRALVPLTVPLILGTLSEVDERAMALEARVAAVVRRRTPLDPPPDRRAERLIRWALVAGALLTVLARVVP